MVPLMPNSIVPAVVSCHLLVLGAIVLVRAAVNHLLTWTPHPLSKWHLAVSEVVFCPCLVSSCVLWEVALAS